MESEEIYMKQEVKMQAAAFKDKKQRAPANKEGAGTPDYENITLTFRNQEKLKGSHSALKNQGKQPSASTHCTALGGAHVPTLSRPPSESARVPRCLHRALTTLYTPLALSCLILLALVLAKNSEMSQELLVLKRELWNVSDSVRECQEEQNQGWSSVQQLLMDIDTVQRSVQSTDDKMNMLLTDMSQIKKDLQEISKALETKPSSCKLGLGRWMRRELQTWLQFPSCGRDMPDIGSPSCPETSTNEKTLKAQLPLPVKLSTCMIMRANPSEPGPRPQGHTPRSGAPNTRAPWWPLSGISASARAPPTSPSRRSACALKAFYGAVKQLGQTNSRSTLVRSPPPATPLRAGPCLLRDPQPPARLGNPSASAIPGLSALAHAKGP
uniref:mast cell-expressed membrane protein 1 n=1 Tax=Odobenus rosmarus divergens TaxID=9708 RepID=UPI00063C081D|nr:PREDICTED: mast cell-expressed membrane protein 1 [Odobenus rosmarus divergens]